MNRPVVLLHGYSDRGESFHRWHDQLAARGWALEEILAASYVSRTNEVTIADLGEGFDRALRTREALAKDQPFDAIVHSTGMLVLREWMMRNPARRARVKHIIGLAPATWGSPLAHKGRSLLGAVFKGERELGPDFGEAGDLILRGLELGSEYTWRLAEADFLGSEAAYGASADTPWPFVFVGIDAYAGLRRLANEPGTDGTVRWAGVGFNSRKISLDLTRDSGGRAVVEDWHNVDVPLVFVKDRNHGTLLRNPPEPVVDAVLEALKVETLEEYANWKAGYAWPEASPAPEGQEWQQFVFRARDERGDAVKDWYLELCSVEASGELERLDAFDLDVHLFKEDPSYRCFHVNLAELRKHGAKFALRLAAVSGTDYVAYHGVGSQNFTVEGAPKPTEGSGKWDAVATFTESLQATDSATPIQLFFPFTTTLIELTFNREPMPPDGDNKVLWFLKQKS